MGQKYEAKTLPGPGIPAVPARRPLCRLETASAIPNRRNPVAHKPILYFIIYDRKSNPFHILLTLFRDTGNGFENDAFSEAALLPILFAALNVSAAIAKLVFADAVVFKAGPDVPDRRFGDVVQRLLGQKRLM